MRWIIEFFKFFALSMAIIVTSLNLGLVVVQILPLVIGIGLWWIFGKKDLIPPSFKDYLAPFVLTALTVPISSVVPVAFLSLPIYVLFPSHFHMHYEYIIVIAQFADIYGFILMFFYYFILFSMWCYSIKSKSLHSMPHTFLRKGSAKKSDKDTKNTPWVKRTGFVIFLLVIFSPYLLFSSEALTIANNAVRNLWHLYVYPGTRWSTNLTATDKPVLINNDFQASFSTHKTEASFCYIACYSRQPGLIKIANNLYMMGETPVEGTYQGSTCQPKGYESQDISTIAYFKNLCSEKIASCKQVDCWAGGRTR